MHSRPGRIFLVEIYLLPVLIIMAVVFGVAHFFLITLPWVLGWAVS